MKTIAFASQKGGAGKSTLAAHMSVLADTADKPALLLDCDPQGSLAFWHSLRVSQTPILAKTDYRELRAVSKDAETEGLDWCFLDGPPHDSAAIAEMMRVADLVVIPTRPSAFDLAAVAATLDMVRALKRPHLVVINSAPPKRGFGHASVTTEARSVLNAMGATVWRDAIIQRAALAHAVAGGLSVGELEPDGAADREMRALWSDVQKLVRA